MIRATLENAEFVKTLKDIDHWLLVNRPGLWVIRLPYLAAYTVTANLGVYLVIQALPLQLHHVGSIFPILWVVFLATLGAFIFWVTRFNRHSAERAFENTSALKGLVDFLIYLGCILALLSPSITASFALVERFDDMISLEEVREDVLSIHGFSPNDRYPSELVEKYTRLDAEARKGMSNGVINRILRINLYRMEQIKENAFAKMWDFFIRYLIVSHFGLVMFATKHIGRKTVYRTVAYGIGLIIFYKILLLFHWFWSGTPTFLGRLIDKFDDVENISLWVYCIVLVLIELISSSVFQIKRYQEFVAMNIALLPVWAYFPLSFGVRDYLDETIVIPLSVNDEMRLRFLVFSPLIYAWMTPLLRSMYMRLLSLPREG